MEDFEKLVMDKIGVLCAAVRFYLYRGILWYHSLLYSIGLQEENILQIL